MRVCASCLHAGNVMKGVFWLVKLCHRDRAFQDYLGDDVAEERRLPSTGRAVNADETTLCKFRRRVIHGSLLHKHEGMTTLARPPAKWHSGRGEGVSQEI